MKNNPVHEIESALAKCEGIEAKISHTEKFTSDAAGELKSLEIGADLADNAALSRITQLQTLAELAPRRILGLYELLATAENDLVTVCNNFISKVLGGRCRLIEEKIADRVRRDLSALITHKDALERAVNESAPMREIEVLQFGATIESTPHNGPKHYARKLMDVSAATDAFEKKYLS